MLVATDPVLEMVLKQCSVKVSLNKLESVPVEAPPLDPHLGADLSALRLFQSLPLKGKKRMRNEG